MGRKKAAKLGIEAEAFRAHLVRVIDGRDRMAKAILAELKVLSDLEEQAKERAEQARGMTARELVKMAEADLPRIVRRLGRALDGIHAAISGSVDYIVEGKNTVAGDYDKELQKRWARFLRTGREPDWRKGS